MTKSRDKGISTKTHEDKLALLSDLLRYAYDNTDSYEEVPEFSADLLYVVSAIVLDDYCEFAEMDSRQLVKMLREHYPSSRDEIWQYVRDESDIGKTAEQLDDKYNPEGDGEHPVWTREQWRHAVVNEDTAVGYWAWVAYRIELEHYEKLAETSEKKKENGR